MADINNPRQYLEELLSLVDARDSAESTLEKGEQQKRELSAKLTSLKKIIDKEKNDTARRRKIDLEAGYDKQIRAAVAEIKSAQDNRQKALNEGIKKRTQEATKSSYEAASNDEKAFRAYVSAQKLPMLMRNKAYFALFTPAISGYVILLVIFVVLLIISIMGISKSASQGGWALPFFIALFVLDIAALCVYVLIWTNTRVKYRDQISAAREILKSVKGSKKAARDIENSIRKTGDDSSYGLESFDALISEKNASKAKLEAQKAQALSQFENETRLKLYSDIDANYKPRLDEIESGIFEADNAINTAKTTISEKESVLTSDFVSFVGQENLTHERVSKLIGYIDNGCASSVTEAVSRLSNPEKVSDN